MPKTLQSPALLARRQWQRLAGIWLALGGLLAGALWFDRLEVRERERERLEHQAGIIHDNVARQLRSIHAVLARLVDEPLALPEDARARRQANARLHTLSDALSGVRTLSVLDAQGMVQASNRDGLIGQSFAYRDYFRAARQAPTPDTLVIGAPFRAMLDGGWYLTLARVLRGADGGFGGVVLATLDPEEFRLLLESVRYAPDMATGLVHGDGLRFLWVDGEGEAQLPGVDVAQPGTAFTRHRSSGAGAAQASVLVAPLLPGGAPALMVLRDIAPPELHMDRPLVAAAARDWDAVFEGWRTTASVVALAYVLLGALAAMALWFVQMRRRDRLRHAHALAVQRAQIEGRWRAVLEATTLGLWEWRGPGDTAYFSPAWKALLGYGDGEIDDAAHDWRSRLHPDERERVLAQLARHLRGETPLYEATHRVRRKDGSYRWVHARGRVVERDAAGQVLRFVGTYADVTEEAHARLRLDRLAEHVPGALFQYQREPDGRAHFPYASAGIQDIYGYSAEALHEDATPVFARLHPEDLGPVRAGIERSAATLQPWQAEYRVQLPGRGERWLSGQARPQRLDSGAVLWHGYLQDVTEAKQQALQLQETERLLQHLMNEMPIGLAMVDEAGRMYFRNQRFLEYFGYTEQEVPTLAAWWQAVCPDPAYRAQASAGWSAALRQAAHDAGDIAPQEYRTRARDGTERTMAVGGLTFGGHFLATFVDRTEQQAQSELLRKLAYMDSLTEVANRRHFDQTLEAEWRRCRRSRQPLSLVMIDIDHFKQFNDRYGHQAGDACMRTVAAALRAGLGRSHDLVARYGGEEFVCLLPECDLAGASAKAQALCQAVQALGIAHDGSSVAPVVTISAGVACEVPAAEHGAQALLARADAHLYRAKAAGRNRVDNGTDTLP